jgi:hypothetical protein
MSDNSASTLSKEQQQKMADDKAYNKAVDTEITKLLKDTLTEVKSMLDSSYDEELIPIFDRSSCAIILFDEKQKTPSTETPLVPVSIPISTITQESTSTTTTTLAPITTETTTTPAPITTETTTTPAPIPTTTTTTTPSPISTETTTTPAPIPTENPTLTSSADMVTAADSTSTQEQTSEHFSNSFMESKTLTWILIVILILLGLFILNNHFHIINL